MSSFFGVSDNRDNIAIFFFSLHAMLLSDLARPVVSHLPTNWVEHGYVRLCCVDRATLVEVGLGLDVGAVLKDISIRVFPHFHSLPITLSKRANSEMEDEDDQGGNKKTAMMTQLLNSLASNHMCP